MQKPSAFELDTVFRVDTSDILSARQRALMIHHGKDIDAAGDEVEMAVRRIFERRLPTGYYVGHGHVIDSSWACSGQLDMIIADTFGCPVLFRSENGTEYFPYESVYAIAEIKSSYGEKKDVTGFIDKIGQLKKVLHREATPKDFISSGKGRGYSISGLSSMDRRPYKNPLFSFMLFIDSRDLRLKHLQDIAESYTPGDLPTFLCFLDRGLLGLGRFSKESQFAGIHEMPEFAALYEETGMFSEWTWLHNEDTAYGAPATLARLYFFLLSHLQNCILIPPDVQSYGQRLFDAGSPRWLPLQSKSLPPRFENTV